MKGHEKAQDAQNEIFVLSLLCFFVGRSFPGLLPGLRGAE